MKQRHCKKCGAILASLNKADVCFCHPNHNMFTWNYSEPGIGTNHMNHVTWDDASSNGN